MAWNSTDLAIKRTRLAEQRTHLAYLRTTIAMFGAMQFITTAKGRYRPAPALIGTVVIGLSSMQYYCNDMKSLAHQQTHVESNIERLGDWLPLLNALIGASLLWVVYYAKRPD